METIESGEFSIPEGWGIQRYCDEDDFVVLRRPGSVDMFVTVDLCRRMFGSGIGIPSRHEGPPVTYVGRRWKQTIIDDAIDWLNSHAS